MIAGNPTLANEQNSQCYQTDNIVPQGRTATRLATQQELLQTIEMILDGTHPARMPRQEMPEDAESNEADTAEIRNAIGHISTRMVSVRRMVNRAGANRGKNLKPALRGLINMLEELYSRV